MPDPAEVKRAEAKAAVEAAAWDGGQECPTCHEGRVPGGPRLIHCLGSFTGADRSVDSVLAMIDAAAEVRWVDGFMGHDLAVTDPAGKTWRFQVKKPGATA